MISDSDEPVEYPIDGTLDLHQFRPDETREVVLEFIVECLRRNILAIRIVHGKGTGRMRDAVREALKDSPLVSSFEEADEKEGGAGVTIAELR